MFSFKTKALKETSHGEHKERVWKDIVGGRERGCTIDTERMIGELDLGKDWKEDKGASLKVNYNAENG